MAMLRSTSEMKDSGTRYLSEVPINWKVNKLKRYLRREEPKNPGNVPVLSLYRELGIVLKDSRDDNHNVTSENTSNYKYVQVGDFVVNKMKAWQGSVAVSEYEGIVSPAYYVYHFMNNAFNRRYFHYLLRGAYKEEFMSLSGGIRIGQWDLPSDALDNVLVLVPPLSEQQAIANYLDNRCSKIDEIIAEATASIEEYKELKESVIDDALKGYQDIHIKLRQLGTLKNGLNFHGSEDSPNIMFLGVGCVKDNMFLERREQFEELHADFKVSGEYLLRDGDIIFVRSNGSKELVGRSVMVRNIDYPLTYSGFCIRFRNERTDLVINEYLLYFFRTHYFKQSLLKFSKDSTNINNLNQEMLNAIRIDAPMCEKQKELVDLLERRTQGIESLIFEKQALIDDLQAYKKSLIYEVVTGKRRVV